MFPDWSPVTLPPLGDLLLPQCSQEGGTGQPGDGETDCCKDEDSKDKILTHIFESRGATTYGSRITDFAGEIALGMRTSILTFSDLYSGLRDEINSSSLSDDEKRILLEYYDEMMRSIEAAEQAFDGAAALFADAKQLCDRATTEFLAAQNDIINCTPPLLQSALRHIEQATSLYNQGITKANEADAKVLQGIDYKTHVLGLIDLILGALGC